MASELRGLIERLEKLDEPSREVDARIAVLCGDVVMRGDDENGYAFFRAPVKKGDWAFLSNCRRGIDEAYQSLGECLSTEHYTASLDATIALCERVLPKAFYGVERTGLHPGMIPGSPDKPFEAKAGDWGTPCRAYADTPALALCLAILRAIQKEGDHG